MKKTFIFLLMLCWFTWSVFAYTNVDENTIENESVAKSEIKILSLKQQKQVRDAIAKMDNTRLQTIIDKIDANLAKIQAKRVKRSQDKKNIQVLEDVKTLIAQHVTENQVVNPAGSFDSVTDLYITQIQKARDTTRLNDLYSLRASAEQYYQDNAEYPLTIDLTTIGIYVPKIPKDPKDWEIINGCKFWYNYKVGPDANGIKNGAYLLSTCFENSDNIEKKAKNDGWTDPLRYEVDQIYTTSGGNKISSDWTFDWTSSYYEKRQNTIYWGHNNKTIISWIDTDTFMVSKIDPQTAKDKYNVYHVWYVIKWADAETYSVLSSFYGKDKNHVYLPSLVIDYIKWADPQTFVIIGGGLSYYAQDKNFIYCAWQPLKDVDISTFQLLTDSNGSFSKDKNHIYYYSDSIKNADVASFVSLGNNAYAKDKNHIYYWSSIIKDADALSFVLISAFEAKDKNHNYTEWKITH